MEKVALTFRDKVGIGTFTLGLMFWVGALCIFLFDVAMSLANLYIWFFYPNISLNESMPLWFFSTPVVVGALLIKLACLTDKK